jgi:hypothetical protein
MKVLKKVVDKTIEIMSEDSKQRKGQALFNAIGETHPELYKKYTGTEYDCFYDDSKISKTLEKLLEESEI